MARFNRIRISQGALYNMIMSVVDAWPREQSGDVYGFTDAKGLIVTNVSPIISAQRRPTHINPVKASIKRREGIEGAIATNRSLQSSYIGSYHSHITKNPYKFLEDYDPDILSDIDLIGAEEEMGKRSLDNFIELILKFEKKQYTLPHAIGETYVQYPNRLKVIMKPEESSKKRTTKIGYDITFLGHFIKKKDNYYDLRKKFPRKENVRKRLSYKEIP